MIRIRWRLIVGVSVAFWIVYTGGCEHIEPCHWRRPSTCEDWK